MYEEHVLFNMAKPTAKHPVKATKTTFEIVEGLRELNGSGVTKLANHVGRAKSNVHNYLSTLQELGYVVKKEEEYYVSLQFLGLGTAARNRYHLYDIAKTDLDNLARESGEHAYLMVEEYGQGVYLYHAAGENAVNVDASLGSSVNLHNTGLGKAILAHLPQERVDEIIEIHGLPPSTENTITDPEELHRELDDIRDEGVAHDREERLPGVRCVAVPIINASGTVEGAISVSGPKSRISGDCFHEKLPQKLKNTANVIELNSSYQ